MSWDAGAITGGLQFDVSQYTSAIKESMSQGEAMGNVLGSIENHAARAARGMADSASHAERLGEKEHEAEEKGHGLLDVLKEHALAGAGFASGMSVVEIALESVKKAFELAWESAKKFGEIIVEVGNKEQNIGLDALKSGVSVEFFDQMAAAGARVGVSADTISNAFKLLQKNAADAVSGLSQDAAKGFESIGISTEWLSGHLDNTQAIFEEFRAHLQQLPTESQQAAAALRIMGRGANDLRPLLKMSDDEMAEAIGIHNKLGAAATKASVEEVQGFIRAKAALGDLVEGMERIAASPILKTINDHWVQIRDTIMNVGVFSVEVITRSFDFLASGLDRATLGFAGLLLGVKAVLDAMGSMGHAMHIPGLENVNGSALSASISSLGSMHAGLNEMVRNSYGFRDDFEKGMIRQDVRKTRDPLQSITDRQMKGIDDGSARRIADALFQSHKAFADKTVQMIKAHHQAAKSYTDSQLTNYHMKQRTGSQF